MHLRSDEVYKAQQREAVSSPECSNQQPSCWLLSCSLPWKHLSSLTGPYLGEIIAKLVLSSPRRMLTVVFKCADYLASVWMCMM